MKWSDALTPLLAFTMSIPALAVVPCTLDLDRADLETTFALSSAIEVPTGYFDVGGRGRAHVQREGSTRAFTINVTESNPSLNLPRGKYRLEISPFAKSSFFPRWCRASLKSLSGDSRADSDEYIFHVSTDGPRLRIWEDTAGGDLPSGGTYIIEFEKR